MACPPARSLPALLHELSDCLATAITDDAVSQMSTEAESVAVRMRSVLLSLVGECIHVETVREKDLLTVLKLISLALDRYPSMFSCNRCSTAVIMILHLLRFCAEPRLRNAKPSLLTSIKNLLSLVFKKEKDRLMQIFKGIVAGLEDLTGILQIFFDAGEVSSSIVISLSCFEEVQRATTAQLTADRPSDPAAPLIYRSGLSESGLALTLNCREQCCLLASALMLMLSHLLRLGPGLSLSALNPHTPGLMLELLGIGNLELQAAVLDIFCLLMDISWWTYDIPMDKLLESISMLMCAQQPSDCKEPAKAHWDSTILALLQKIVSSRDLKACQRSTVLSALRALSDRASNAHVREGVIDIYATLNSKGLEKTQLDVQKLVSIAANQAADSATWLNIGLTMQPCLMRCKMQSTRIQSAGSVAGSSANRRVEDNVKRRLRGGTSAPQTKRRRGPQGAPIPVEPVVSSSQENGNLSVPPSPAQRGLEISMQQRQLLSALRPERGNVNINQQLLTLEALLSADDLFNQDLWMGAWKIVQEWGIWAVTALSLQTIGDAKQATLILGAFGAILATNILESPPWAHERRSSPGCTSLAGDLMMTRDQLQQLVSMLWVAFKDQSKQQNCPEELLKFLAVGKVRSLQVELALSAGSILDTSSPFGPSTAIMCATKDQDPVVRAASAWMVAGHCLSPSFKRGKHLQQAWKMLTRLAVDEVVDVKLAAAGAWMLILGGATCMSLVSHCCWAAEAQMPGEEMRLHWCPHVEKSKSDGVFRGEAMNAASFQTFMDALFEGSEDVGVLQGQAVRLALSWLQHASDADLESPGGKSIISKLWTFAQTPSVQAIDMFADFGSVLLPSQALHGTSSGAPSGGTDGAPKDPQIRFVQEWKVLFDSSHDATYQQAVLRVISAIGAQLPRAELVVKIILVSQLDSNDPMMRAVAAGLLQGIATEKAVGLPKLVLDCGHLLEFCGRSHVKKPQLISEIADILETDEKHLLSQHILREALPHLILTEDKHAVEVLASCMGLEVHKLMKLHGAEALARCFYIGIPHDVNSFTAFMEGLLGEDLFHHLALPGVQRDVAAGILQVAGSATEWGDEFEVPSVVLERTRDVLQTLRDVSGSLVESLSDFLLGCDITGILKGIGDALENEQLGSTHGEGVPDLQQYRLNPMVALRSVLLLIRLTGKHLGTFWPQLMALLTQSVRSRMPLPVRLQGLQGWRELVEGLATEAPMQLVAVVDQIVVTLLDSLLEGGKITAAAARVLEDLIVGRQELLGKRLQSIPPLPAHIQGLSNVYAVMKKERGNLTAEEQCLLLVDSLAHPSLSVRGTSLMELRTFLRKHRKWLASNVCGSSSGTRGSCDSTSPLANSMLNSLLACCEPETHTHLGRMAKVACAECLGMLGALDPSRVVVESLGKKTMFLDETALVTSLMKTHLVRLLRVAPSLQVLDATTFAIQETLTTYRQLGAHGLSAAGTEPNEATDNCLFQALPPEVQVLIRPYLSSKYNLQGSVPSHGSRVIFSSFTSPSFRGWLTTWVRELADHQVAGPRVRLYQACNPLYRRDLQLSLFMLPYIVSDVLAFGTESARSLLRHEIMSVLKEGHNTREGELCVQAIFELLDMMKRTCEDSPPRKTGGSGMEDIDSDQHAEHIQQLLQMIPLELLARAAASCGAHARALQYFETRIRVLRGGGRNPAARSSASCTDDDVAFLQEVYGNLEEPDGLAGIVCLRSGHARLEDHLLAAEKAGRWSEALTLYEQALQGESSLGSDAPRTKSDDEPLLDFHVGPAHLGHLRCLLNMGHLQGMLAEVDGWAQQAKGDDCQNIAALGVAGAWRMGKWNLLKRYLEIAMGRSATRQMLRCPWDVSVGSLLKAVHERQWDDMHLELDTRRLEITGSLSAASMESYHRAYPYLVRLHMLQELEDSAFLLKEGSLAGPMERRLCLHWEKRLEITQPSLIHQEPILALRRQLARLSGAHGEAGDCWLTQAQLSRASGHFEAAHMAVLEALSTKVAGAGLERARLLWETDQPHRAIVALQEVIDEDEAANGGRGTQFSPEQKQNHAQALLQMADWKGMSGEGLKADIEELYKRALSLAPRTEKVYFCYARYLDRLMVDAKQRQIAAKSEKSGDRLQGRAKIVLGEDKPFLEITPEVIKAYGSALQHGHKHIYQAMPRMLTVWFEYGNHNVQTKHKSNKEKHIKNNIGMDFMSELVKQLPLYTWLVALPQLTSRICHPNPETSKTTQSILTKLLHKFPHQVLWALAAVSKSTVQARQEAASRVITSVKTQTLESNKDLFKQFAALCDQLIRLCFFQPPPKAREFSVRRDFATLSRMLPLSVMVPTSASFTLSLPATTSLDLSHNPFSNIISIAGIKDEVDVLSSLQKPKKIVLIGSDGREYPFLAKPKDDLRKDSRMMEVAGLLNHLVLKDPEARRRNLYIRRFAVLPLTEDCGIVEWVEHTTGLRHVCQDTYVAIGLFDKRQTNPTIKRIYDAHPAGKKSPELLEKVLTMFPPVMHMWFARKFSEPVSWHNARLAFTRTTAVWSMVGHMVGLGDRHGENILLDSGSGDIVHVDFSCLFDKGLTLAKPEMVPFRLTQNLIDGFGITGIEGVFRKTCEISLQVLRDHRETLVSVLETFVHDPLVEWTQGHRSGDEIDNPHAKDALSTIEGRLTGTLLGVKSQPSLPVSAQGQAHFLIEEAVDKKNLGDMYIWWMPWF